MEPDKATISQQTQIETIVANNPSAMTGTGTNSYVLRNQKTVVIIDPGPDDNAHLAALLASLADNTLAAIVVTHAHLDHSALARRLSDTTSAPILAFGDAASGRHPTIAALVETGMKLSGEGAHHAFAPDIRLKDGDVIHFGSETLRVLHTPGHMGGHICLALGDTLLSGDHVMGWAPSLIAPPDGHIGDYMASLSRLMTENWAAMLPGHGETILNPAQRLQELWQHRKARERSILSALATGPASPRDLTRALYTDTNPALWAAAERSVISHLIDLHERSLVSGASGFQSQSIFRLI